MTDLIERLIEIGGCGDGNCKVHVRPGMHTNGGCRCLKDGFKAQQVFYAYKREVERLTERITALETEVLKATFSDRHDDVACPITWQELAEAAEAERDRAETTGFVAPINDKRPAQSTGEWAEYWQGLKRGPTTTAATDTEKP